MSLTPDWQQDARRKLARLEAEAKAAGGALHGHSEYTSRLTRERNEASIRLQEAETRRRSYGSSLDGEVTTYRSQLENATVALEEANARHADLHAKHSPCCGLAERARSVFEKVKGA